MRDERQDSIRKGINVPEESEIGRRAAEERRRDAARGPRIGGGMGGTSDSDSAGDEAAANAAMRAAEEDEAPDEASYWHLPRGLRGRLLPPE